MTAKEIVYHIKNLKAGGRQSQSVSLSDMQYLAMLDYYRAILIRQSQGHGYKVNDRYVQSLGDLELEDLLFTDKVWTTVRELPVPLEINNGVLITDVRNTYDLPYQKNTANAVQWSHWSRFTSDEPKWYFQGGKISVVNHKSNDKLRVSGVFESPYQVLQFLELDNPMDPLDFPYPMPASLVDTVYKMMIDSEFRFLMLQQQDRVNNSKDENQA